MKKKKNKNSVFKCWLKSQLACFEALLSLEKKNINDLTPSWNAVPFCVKSYKNDIRQQSMFSRITSDKHVLLKNIGGHGTVHFLGPQKRRDAHPCGSVNSHIQQDMVIFLGASTSSRNRAVVGTVRIRNQVEPLATTCP